MKEQSKYCMEFYVMNGQIYGGNSTRGSGILTYRRYNVLTQSITLRYMYPVISNYYVNI